LFTLIWRPAAGLNANVKDHQSVRRRRQQHQQLHLSTKLRRLKMQLLAPTEILLATVFFSSFVVCQEYFVFDDDDGGYLPSSATGEQIAAAAVAEDSASGAFASELELSVNATIEGADFNHDHPDEMFKLKDRIMLVAQPTDCFVAGGGGFNRLYVDVKAGYGGGGGNDCRPNPERGEFAIDIGQEREREILAPT
jgi:hypothetical protein